MTKPKTYNEEFDEMNRKCSEEYGLGEFPPEVKSFHKKRKEMLKEKLCLLSDNKIHNTREEYLAFEEALDQALKLIDEVI